MLEAKCLKKVVVPSTLIENPSPGSLQSTCLALHVSHDPCSCLVYIASGPHIYKLQIAREESSVNKGKEGLLIPEHTELIASSIVNHCPYCSEIQSIVPADTESNGYLILGSVDSYAHLIVSKLHTSGRGFLHNQLQLFGKLSFEPPSLATEHVNIESSPNTR